MSAQSIDQLLNQSLQLQHAGKILEARSGLRKILKRIPAHADALYFIGLTYMKTHEFEKGIASIRRAVTIKPDYAEAHYNLGNALSEMQRYPEAMASYKEVMILKPDHWKACINLGNILYLLKCAEDSITYYRRALAINPDSAEAYIGLGVILAESKRFDEAITSYQQAISLNPHLADAHNNLGFAFNALKQFDKAIPSFKEATALNPGYIDAYGGMAHALVELKLPEEAVLSYKSAFSIRQDTECAYELANLLYELERFGEAIPYYQFVISAKPEFIDAHNALGIAYSEIAAFDKAINAYEQALSLNPEDCAALINQGNVLLKINKINQAIDCYNKALSFAPNFVEAYIGLGNALQQLNQFKEAIASYNRALTIKPESAIAKWNRGLTCLMQGQFQSGWTDYEERWKLKESIPLAETPYPRWIKQESSGKRLIIQFEQGYGDAIQMVRYVNLLEEQGIQCWLQCPEPLNRLVSRSFPDAVVITDESIPEQVDYHIPVMSLPFAMETFSELAIPNAVPYLKADPERIAYWKKRLGDSSSRLVGLVWRGSPTHKNDRNRSSTVNHYIRLISAHPTILFVTLQKDLRREEIELLESHSNLKILDSELTDFDEAAAIMKNLELMITIDSAPAHLAGALAIPTWILLPFNGEWRWLMNRTDSPWYPTAKLFRQKTIGDWNGVINTVDHELKKLELEGIARSNSINQYQTGFTLLELLVVMVIIGLLAGYVGPKYFAQIGKSEVKTARAQLDALGKALDQYRLDTGHYPNTEQGLTALNAAPSDESKWQGPYLQKTVPPDPWGKAYQYKLPGEHGEYDLWSFGKDGQPGGTEESADIVNW